LDAPLVKFRHQMGDRGVAELDGGEIQDDRRADQKTSRAPDSLFNPGNPVEQRRLGDEHHSHV